MLPINYFQLECSKKGRAVCDPALYVYLSNLSFSLFTFHILPGSELEIKKDKILQSDFLGLASPAGETKLH
jgi:hypothetical protein